MSELTVGVVVLPLLAGALVATASRCARPCITHRVGVAGIGVTILCMALLCIEDPSLVTVDWLPNVGPLGLTSGGSGLYAALATAFAAFFVSLGASEFHPLAGTVMLVALAAANAAFLADHYLARYVALEVVALCVALAPLIEVRNSAGPRLASGGYLLLRLGDAGLLAAILILGVASGTLSIAPALEAGGRLDEVRLGWAVAGFLLAVWVKLGAWPFHLWSRTGRRLSLASQAWLYATVAPSLGLYLLYRVAPLLALSEPLRGVAVWLGAGGAVLAALLALAQADLRAGLVHVGAVQGGLALCAAAAGLKPVVWIVLLVLTPVRVLLFLAGDAAREAGSVIQRRVAAALFALGGSAMVALGLLVVGWVQEVEMLGPLRFAVGVPVALLGVWVLRTARRLAAADSGHLSGVSLARWVVVGLSSAAVLSGVLWFRPLAQYLAAFVRTALLLPSLLSLARGVLTSLAGAAVVTLPLWLFRRRWFLAAALVGQGYDLESVLTRVTQALRAVIEIGVLEQAVELAARGVAGAARSARAVERAGLEGFLRGVVRVVMRFSRRMQRYHTGRLRRNLLWVPVALGVAVVALVVCGW